MNDVMNGYLMLRNAIIEQACVDYLDAVKTLQQDKTNQDAISEIADVESFIKSDYFESLIDVDGEVFLEKLKKKAMAECGKKTKKFIRRAA